MDLVRSRAEELRRAMAELGVTNIALVGSAARGDDDCDSDIDLLADIDESVGLFRLMQATASAEEILGRPVDLVPRDGAKSEIENSMRRDAVLLDAIIEGRE